MIKTRKSIFFLICSLIFASIGSAYQPYDGQDVKDIQIIVESRSLDSEYDTTTIRTKLKTKEGAPFSQTTFDKDLKNLSKDFDRVQPKVSSENDKISVQLILWPRPVIHQINWDGPKQIDKSKLQKELDVKPHTVFNREKFNHRFNKLKELYIKQGYFESQLSYSIEPIEGTDLVDVNIHVNEGRSGKIRNIELKGFTSDEQSELLDEIYTKKYNFFTSWFMGTGTYREEILEHDKMTIINFLHNKGYADATISIDIEDLDNTGKIAIIITAHRGPLYRFGTVQFDGNTLIPYSDIEKHFLIKSGEIYSPEKLRETAQSIKDLYGQKGYIEANVQYETDLKENEPIFNVNFYLVEGDQFRVGLIHVFGNAQTNNNVILRESLLVPGEVFDSRKLKATQQRLENIGYFKNVNVYAVRSQEDLGLGENYRDVYIEVEETATGNASLFVGFSSLDNVFGGLDLTERNFNIKGFADVITKGKFSSLRGAGEYAHAKVNIGAKQTNYIISWLDPYFRDSLWRLGFDLSYTTSRLQSEEYDIDTFGGSVNTSYPISNYWTYGAKYRLRDTKSEIQSKAGSDALEFKDNKGIISAIGTSLSFDSTDSSYRAHRGLRSSLEVETSGLGGDFTFLKLNFLNTLYQYIWRKGTLKYRADLRFIYPYGKTSINEVPLSERIFLGGENTVRGYKPYIIGPQTNGSEPAPTGGISSTLLSMEYCQEIFRLLDVFAFIDAGSVSLKKFDFSTLRASYGVGARIELMNRTPIVVGYGIPINPERPGEEDDGDEQKFFFSMGGQF